MPLYDYECRKCGPFQEWRSIDAFDKPSRCPDCGKAARRSLATPGLGMRNSALRKAHQINERSAEEPRVVRRKRGDPVPTHDVHRDLTEASQSRHAHQHGHGHDHGHKKDLHRSNHPWALKH
jgi:putative FmdB family regulatory protein